MAISVEDINTAIAHNLQDYIHICDSTYRMKIESVAKDIINVHRQKPIIIICGPSGSSKTTSAIILKEILESMSITTHILSLDNYFSTFTKEQTQLARRGKIDLESPSRLDIPFLNEELKKILAGTTVKLYRYNFKIDQRVPTGKTLTRKLDDLVIIEGTHSLNPEVISIPREKTFNIYVDTEQTITHGVRTLKPPVLRLIRRMIRDKRYRNRSVKDTFDMFGRVEIGERKFILPYKQHADVHVDTFIPYELSVFKEYLKDDMDVIKNHLGLTDIVDVLNTVTEIDPNEISSTSVIREFIGNSDFKYF